MTWWGVRLSCQKCQELATLVGASFSADGELEYSFDCPVCHEKYTWHIFASQLAHRALTYDAEKGRKEESKEVKPPSPPLFTDGDKKFLGDFHISQEEA